MPRDLDELVEELVMVLLVVAMIVLVLRAGHLEHKRAEACEAKGGVYLRWDDACVPGIPEGRRGA